MAAVLSTHAGKNPVSMMCQGSDEVVGERQEAKGSRKRRGVFQVG